MIQAYQQVLSFYKHASELPPADIESRAIIARAYNRLGFTRANLSRAKGTKKDGPDKRLLSQAEDDYRRSLALFEELHAESPVDRNVRRYYADAMGVPGWGWLFDFTHRPQEAEPHYRRAVQLWRELVRDAGTKTKNSTGASQAPESVSNELNDLGSMVDMVSILARLLEGMGRAPEAEDLRVQLDEDVAAYAARFLDPDLREQRQYLARKFMSLGTGFLTRHDRLPAALYLRLVTILDPENAKVHNNLAWAMTSVPGLAPFPAARALASARKAVELDSKNWIFWNTLGVVAYRSQDWKTADKSLQRSIKLNDGGGAVDFLFLAMTRWHQGKADKAQELFKRATDYVNRNPGDPELYQFHVEASTLLAQPCPSAEPKMHQGEKEEDPTETAHTKTDRTKKYYYFLFGLLPPSSLGEDNQAG